MTGPADELPAVERTSVLASTPALARRTDAALGALTLVRDPALVPLLRAQQVGDAHALTHLVPTGAEPLAALRARAPLRPGHVATVALAVLQALDTLHRGGLAHGAVDAAHVLVAPDGRVVLDGCGLAWSIPAGEPGGPTAAEDVAGVALLLRDLLGPGTAPPALVLAALRAADDDPRVRPDARDLAAAIAAAVPVEPLLDLLWLTAGVPPRPHPEPRPVPAAPARAPMVAPQRPGARRRRARRSRARGAAGAAAVAVLALLVLARIAVMSAAAADPPAADARPTAASPVASTATPSAAAASAAPVLPAPVVALDWAAVLARADEGRRAALASGSAAALARWVDPQGPAYAADTALLARLRAAGARLEGGALRRVSVELLAVDGATARLRVRDVREAYTVVVEGRRTAVARRPERTWEVALSAWSGGWRVLRVEPAAQ